MFTLTVPAPKNVNEATAQALRFERAKAIIAEGYTFTFHAELELIYITKPGSEHADYFIHKNRCSCPDADKGFCCKHYIAAWILQEEANEAAADEAQAAAYEADMAACEDEVTGVGAWF